MAREKSRAEKGCRSSIASPTPMKCTGRSGLRGDGDQDAAARRAVQLGHDEPGHPCLVAKNLDLIQRVLARRRVERQQHGMRRGGVVLADDADDLGKLRHQLGLVVQPAGGVDQEHVGAGFLAASSASKARPAASEPGARAMTGDLRPLAPDFQLLDRRGAKSVAGGEHYGSSLGAEARGELADRRGLAGAVDADHQDHERLLARRRSASGFATGASDFSTSAARTWRTSSGGNLLVEPLLAERVDDAGGGRRAEVGFQQQFLKLFKAFGVELSLGEDVGDAGGEVLGAPRESPDFSRLHQPEGADFCCRDRGVGRWILLAAVMRTRLDHVSVHRVEACVRPRRRRAAPKIRASIPPLRRRSKF